MAQEKQTGLMPPWPRGRVVQDAFGFFSALFLGSTFLSLFRPVLWPNRYDPPQPIELLFPFVSGCLLALVWGCLKRGALAWAAGAAWVNAIAGFGLLLATVVLVIQGKVIGIGMPAALGLNTIYLTGAIFAACEVSREIARRF